jgi:hypothetical protein
METSETSEKAEKEEVKEEPKPQAPLRTLDIQTGLELDYDLSKVYQHDTLNESKLEEYSEYVQDVFKYYRERDVSIHYR